MKDGRTLFGDFEEEFKLIEISRRGERTQLKEVSLAKEEMKTKSRRTRSSSWILGTPLLTTTRTMDPEGRGGRG